MSHMNNVKYEIIDCTPYKQHRPYSYDKLISFCRTFSQLNMESDCWMADIAVTKSLNRQIP